MNAMASTPTAVRGPWPSWRTWALLSLALAGVIVAHIWAPLSLYRRFGIKVEFLDFVDLIMLPLWIVAIAIAVVRHPPPRIQLWWLLLPAPLCFLHVAQWLFVTLSFMRGFAP
jgi:hypothetical protein